MSMTRTVTFGQFQLVPRHRALLHQGKPIPLGSRALDILIALVENAGEVVPKDVLLAQVWPGLSVEESSLRVHIAAIRRALRDGVDGARFISNVPNRGYSFIAPLQVRDENPHVVAQEPAGVAGFSGLPLQTGAVIGRDELIRVLVAQQSERRLITIAGPGGIGKTTVALAAARMLTSTYADGVFFVDFSAISDNSFVPSTLSTAAGIALHPEEPVAHLVATLRGKRMLLVLDCCEHVITAVAEIVSAILRYTQNTSVLCTSREALRIDSEWVQRIPPLSVPPALRTLTASDAMRSPAVQLFVERAAERLGGYSLSDADAPFVAAICRKLDGIALAIELAAGRLDTVGIHDLAWQIDDRLRLLRNGRRTALPRHQTLRATLDWSYNRLASPEQLLLNRLSIFSGAFCSTAASAVCTGDELDETNIPELVSDLVEKSLVAATLDRPRVSYKLLETTRSYASEKLAQGGESAALSRRHAEYIRNVFQKAADEWEAKPTDSWITRYMPQIENVRAALTWAFSPDGDPELGITLTMSAAPLWAQLSLADEFLEWVNISLSEVDAFSDDDPRRKMTLYAALGGLQMYAISSVKQSNDAWARALALATELQDTDYQLRSLRALWAEGINSGRFNQALVRAEQFRNLALGAGTISDQAISDRLVGTALHFMGDHDKALEAIDGMLSRHDTSFSASQLVRYQFNQKVSARIIRERILWLRGHIDAALRDIEQNVEEALTLDHTMSLCNVLTQAACPISILAKEYELARRYVSLLHERTAPRAFDIWHTYAICFDAEMQIDHGDVQVGLSQLNSSIKDLRNSDFGHNLTMFTIAAARGLAKLNKLAEAQAAVDGAIDVCERNGERWSLPELFRAKGELLVQQGTCAALDAAQRMFLQSLDVARAQNAPMLELRTAVSLARSTSHPEVKTTTINLIASLLERFDAESRCPALAEANALLDAHPQSKRKKLSVKGGKVPPSALQ
ncbi:winged helix-turn-helix domain-containing protein [Bradyrhizobium lablabi]|uniref:ATP-binding protein n=1 Tax=Bradyrhizobium lablabi TaxID=722472 RepID=UPI001BA91DC4|nr:winged helix-turn-helix domain-containing protein [Bradyrhizobium lablabi]MBR0695641.1 winged helix-turn-helix domain-containing protein [Bradyrhizobium lablabi]